MGLYLSSLLQWQRAKYGFCLAHSVHNDEALYYLYYSLSSAYERCLNHPHDITHDHYLLSTPLTIPLHWQTYLHVDDVAALKSDLDPRYLNSHRPFMLRDITQVESQGSPVMYTLKVRGASCDAKCFTLGAVIQHFQLLLACKLKDSMLTGDAPLRHDEVAKGLLRGFLIEGRMVTLCRGGRDAYDLLVSEMRAAVLIFSQCSRDGTTVESIRTVLSKLMLEEDPSRDIVLMTDALKTIAKHSVVEDDSADIDIQSKSLSFSMTFSKAHELPTEESTTDRMKHGTTKNFNPSFDISALSMPDFESQSRRGLITLVPDATVLRDKRWDAFSPDEIILQLRKEILGTSQEESPTVTRPTTASPMRGTIADSAPSPQEESTIGSLNDALERFETKSNKTPEGPARSTYLEAKRARQRAKQISLETSRQTQRALDAEIESDDDSFSEKVVPLMVTKEVKVMGSLPTKPLPPMEKSPSHRSRNRPHTLSEEARVKLVAFFVALRKFDAEMLALGNSLGLNGILLKSEDCEEEVQGAAQWWTGVDPDVRCLRAIRWVEEIGVDEGGGASSPEHSALWDRRNGVYGTLQLVLHDKDLTAITVRASSSGYSVHHRTGGAQPTSIVDTLLLMRNCNAQERDSLPVSRMYPSLRTLLLDHSPHFAASSHSNAVCWGSKGTPHEALPEPLIVFQLHNHDSASPKSPKGLQSLRRRSAFHSKLAKASESPRKVPETPQNGSPKWVPKMGEEEDPLNSSLRKLVETTVTVDSARKCFRKSHLKTDIEQLRRRLNRHDDGDYGSTALSDDDSGDGSIDTSLEETMGSNKAIVSPHTPRKPPIDYVGVANRLHSARTLSSAKKQKPPILYSKLVKRLKAHKLDGTIYHDTCKENSVPVVYRPLTTTSQTNNLESTQVAACSPLEEVLETIVPFASTPFLRSIFISEAERETLCPPPDKWTFEWDIQLARQNFSLVYVREQPVHSALIQALSSLWNQFVGSSDLTKGQVQAEWIDSLKPPVIVAQVLFVLASLLDTDCSSRCNYAKIVRLGGHKHLAQLLQPSNDLRVRIAAAKVFLRMAQGDMQEGEAGVCLISMHTLEAHVRETLRALSSLTAVSPPVAARAVRPTTVLEAIDDAFKMPLQNTSSKANRTEFAVVLVLLMLSQIHSGSGEACLSACRLAAEILNHTTDPALVSSCSYLLFAATHTLYSVGVHLPRSAVEAVMAHLRKTSQWSSRQVQRSALMVLHLVGALVPLLAHKEQRTEWLGEGGRGVIGTLLTRFVSIWESTREIGRESTPLDHSVARRLVLACIHVLSLVEAHVPVSPSIADNSTLDNVLMRLVAGVMAPLLPNEYMSLGVGPFASFIPLAPGMGVTCDPVIEEAPALLKATSSLNSTKRTELPQESVLFLSVATRFLAGRRNGNPITNHTAQLCTVLMRLDVLLFSPPHKPCVPDAISSMLNCAFAPLVTSTQSHSLQVLSTSVSAHDGAKDIVHGVLDPHELTNYIELRRNPLLVAQGCQLLSEMAMQNVKSAAAVRSEPILRKLSHYLRSAHEEVLRYACDAVASSIVTQEDAMVVSQKIMDLFLPLLEHLKGNDGDTTCGHVARLLSQLAIDARIANYLIDLEAVALATEQLLHTQSPLAHQYLCRLICILSLQNSHRTVGILEMHPTLLPALVQLVKKSQSDVPLLRNVVELIGSLSKSVSICQALISFKAGQTLVPLLGHHDHAVQDAVATTLQHLRNLP